MFVTDGHLSKSTCTIHFSQKDERILKVIAKYMNADYVLAPIGPTKQTPTLLINSQTLKDDLEALGITPNKSFTLQMPPVPQCYLPAFIRGVIDGDGHIDDHGYVMFITTASLVFAESLIMIFKRWHLNTYLKKVDTKKSKLIYRVYVSGKEMIVRLANIIYANVNTNNENFHIYKRIYFTQHSETPYLPSNIEIRQSKSIKAKIDRKLVTTLRDIAMHLQKPLNHLIEPILLEIVENSQLHTNHSNSTSTDKILVRLKINSKLYNQLKELAQINDCTLTVIVERAFHEYVRRNTSSS